MPREMFRSHYDTPNESYPFVSLGWGNNAPEVQIGVLHDVGQVRDHLLDQLSELLPQLLPEALVEVVDGLTQPESGVLGWHTQLDRQGVNRLIRTLRKARDHSFGADA